MWFPSPLVYVCGVENNLEPAINKCNFTWDKLVEKKQLLFPSTCIIVRWCGEAEGACQTPTLFIHCRIHRRISICFDLPICSCWIIEFARSILPWELKCNGPQFAICLPKKYSEQALARESVGKSKVRGHYLRTVMFLVSQSNELFRENTELWFWTFSFFIFA